MPARTLSSRRSEARVRGRGDACVFRRPRAHPLPAFPPAFSLPLHPFPARWCLTRQCTRRLSTRAASTTSMSPWCPASCASRTLAAISV